MIETLSPQHATAVVIVAAGRGNRSGYMIPKQYLSLGGSSVLRRTVEALLSPAGIDVIQVVIGPDDLSSYEEAVRGLPRLLQPVTGGRTRQESVRCGLEALAASPPEIVLVHDAARPFVSTAVIERVIAACGDMNGAIPALALTETLKQVEGTTIRADVPRAGVAAAQTPQGFPFRPLLQAHRKAAAAGRDDLTDDAAVALLAGLPVQVVEGERANVKLTTAEDFAIAERMLMAASETRTAQGFDVHAFGPGASVWLCGVEIPNDLGLVGHSDADVGLHALTDALLGTIGDGDIGQHFPPTDPTWKGARSDRFLADAARRVRERSGRILHLDVTLICERPKIGPYRESMRQMVAAIAQVSLHRVSIKATTSERLGFVGRGEGIAALASATVALPAQE